MNFKETMVKAMTSRGMFETQAEAVMKQIIENNLIQDMESRWYEETSHYPQNLVNILWVSVKEITYTWIEEHVPLAWFKPMFQYSDKELTDMINEKEEATKK